MDNIGNYNGKNFKFMQSLDPKWTKRLKKMARKRGITMQELIRAAIIPEWWSHQPKESRK
jgi:hypothetical protein